MTRADPQLSMSLPSFYRVDKVESTTDDDLHTALLLDDIKYNLHFC